MLKASDLVGGYTVMSGEKYGENVPKDHIANTTARFTEDAIVVTDKQRGDVYASTYKLNGGETPCRITMTSKLAPNEGEVAEGIIEKDGDTVRLAYALPGNPTPTGFETKAGQLMFVMTNLNK